MEIPRAMKTMMNHGDCKSLFYHCMLQQIALTYLHMFLTNLGILRYYLPYPLPNKTTTNNTSVKSSFQSSIVIYFSSCGLIIKPSNTPTAVPFAKQYNKQIYLITRYSCR